MPTVCTDIKRKLSSVVDLDSVDFSGFIFNTSYRFFCFSNFSSSPLVKFPP